MAVQVYLPDEFVSAATDRRLGVADMGAYMRLLLAADERGRIEASVLDLAAIMDLSKRIAIETLRRMHAAGVVVYRPTDTRYINSVVIIIGHQIAPMNHRTTNRPDAPSDQRFLDDDVPDEIPPMPTCNEKKNLRSKSKNNPQGVGGGSGRGTRKYAEDSVEYQLALTMLTQIRKHLDENRTADLNAWADQFRLLQERDKRTPLEMNAVMRWLYGSGDRDAEFWRTVVLSPRKFREKFPTLIVKMPKMLLRNARPERQFTACTVCGGNGWQIHPEHDEATRCTAEGCENGRVYA